MYGTWQPGAGYRYSYTQLVTNKHPRYVDMTSAEARLPPGGNSIALVHSHPHAEYFRVDRFGNVSGGVTQPEYPNPDDFLAVDNGATRYGVPLLQAYVVTETGRIHGYLPAFFGDAVIRFR